MKMIEIGKEKIYMDESQKYNICKTKNEIKIVNDRSIKLKKTRGYK